MRIISRNPRAKRGLSGGRSSFFVFSSPKWIQRSAIVMPFLRADVCFKTRRKSISRCAEIPYAKSPGERESPPWGVMTHVHVEKRIHPVRPRSLRLLPECGAGFRGGGSSPLWKQPPIATYRELQK